MTFNWLPNVITGIRLVLLAPLVYLLINEEYRGALIVFFVAGVSDAIDGYLAKTYNWVSRLGAIMDPLADKALLGITYVLLCVNEQIPISLLVLVLLRDIVIIGGAYIYHRKLGPYRMTPSYLSKFNTFMQLLLVVCILTTLGVVNLPKLFLDVVMVLTYVTTVSSGFHYVWVWGRKYRQAIANKG